MENLKNLRLRRNLTQKELAESLQLRQQAISLLEKKKIEPDIETLKKLANFFKVSIDFLVGNEKTQPKIELATNIQKNLIQLILELNDIECKNLEAYINGMLQAKKEYYKKIN